MIERPGELRGDERGVAAPSLAAVVAGARAVADAPTLLDALQGVAAATAAAAGADVVLVRVREDGQPTLVTRAVFAPSRALAAELEGSRIAVDEVSPERDLDEIALLPQAARAAAARSGARAVLLVPVRRRGDIVGTLELLRRGHAFQPHERDVAHAASDEVAAALRAFHAQRDTRNGARRGAVELAAEALAAAGDGVGAADEIVRVAVAAAGARAGVLWSIDGDDLRLAAAHAAADDAPRWHEFAVRSLREIRPVAVDADTVGERSPVATLLLGHPPLGVLQVALSEPPAELELRALATFAVRAAHALRSAERSELLQVELERTRALLEVVAQANEQLSLAHTLETTLARVAELLAVERVAAYLRADGGRLVEAAARSVEGPHVRVAERLLDLALGPFRGRGMLLVEDARSDRRLAGLEREVAEAEIDAAVAAPLVVADEVVGLLGLYPARWRTLTQNEWALLGALSAQLAVSVQNARLHEDVARSDEERKEALEAERQASRRVAALYEISRAFAQSLSLETTLDAIARTVVELLDVDAAVIRMPDERGDLLFPRALHVADAALGVALAPLLLRPQPLEKPPRRHLPARGRALVLDPEVAARLPGHQLLVPFLEKGSSAVVVPIATASELLGTLTLLSLDPERTIGAETIEIALSVAGQSALAIDNARLYQQQKEFADTMQRSLLPRTHPELRGLELGDAYQSSARVEVGGDVYDFLTLHDGRLAVVLGDVTGHGIEAAADMAMAKFVFRSIAREHPEPGEFLAAANEIVCGEIGAGKFITMLYLTIDPADGTVVCAGAGHEPPRVVLPDGEARPLEVGGLALGIDREQTYEEARATLAPGASIVLYTDGLVEARRAGELFGHERLDRVLRDRRDSPPDELARAVLEDCRAFAGGTLLDDCAIVVVKRTHG